MSGGSIELIGLRKAYGPIVAIHELTLSVQAGEFVTLLGPSGSGKSTTLLMIAGFEPPDSGQIILAGRDVTFDPPHRRDIGIVFQNYALFPHLTVAGNIAFPLEMRHVPRREIVERVDYALKLVRLGDLGGRYPKQLSGGQQQRVAIARAVVFNPPVLLMDEPLGALDKKLRVEMQSEIKRLQREVGLTIVYVTHDQEEALILSDRIVLINHGLVEQIGNPQEMYEAPRNRFVADFLGETNFLSGTVSSNGEGHVLVKLMSGAVIKVNQDETLYQGANVLVAIRPERVSLATPGDAGCLLTGLVEEASYAGIRNSLCRRGCQRGKNCRLGEVDPIAGTTRSDFLIGVAALPTS